MDFCECGVTDGATVKNKFFGLHREFFNIQIHFFCERFKDKIQRLLIANMVGEWRFVDDGAGTRVTWRYTFFPRSLLRRPVVLVMGELFRRAMQRSLDNLARG